jgi:hypothetical protein
LNLQLTQYSFNRGMVMMSKGRVGWDGPDGKPYKISDWLGVSRIPSVWDAPGPGARRAQGMFGEPLSKVMRLQGFQALELLARAL